MALCCFLCYIFWQTFRSVGFCVHKLILNLRVVIVLNAVHVSKVENPVSLCVALAVQTFICN